MSGLYLSAFIDEEENDGVVRIFGGGSDLSGDPSEFLVREPNFCPLAVYVFRHDWRCPGGGDEGGVGRKFRKEEDVRVWLVPSSVLVQYHYRRIRQVVHTVFLFWEGVTRHAS